MLFEKAKLIEYKAPEPYTRYAKIFFDDVTIPGAHMSIGLFRFEPGQKGPKHVHEEEVEVYYCLKGKGVVVVDQEEFVLEPNSALYIPPKAYHETKNISEEDFEFLGIFAPAINMDNIRNW
ncbi:MAG: cupin domain-containing protein [Bacillota bacterium]